MTLRTGVKFHAGGTLDAEAVAATLRKAADPQAGRNVYPTMSVVRDWTVVNPQTIRLNFTGPVPERQITDLLQFLAVIDPAGIATIDTRAAGTGPYTVAERVVGQRVRMTKNPNYWREREPGIFERADWDEGERTLTLSVRRGDEASTMHLAWLSPPEWRLLLDRAGFDVVAQWGWFDRRPYAGGEDVVFAAVRRDA